MADNILEPVRAYTANLQIGLSEHIDCYELPGGELRVGFAGASIALGHEKNWLGRLPSNSKRLFKTLQGAGYTGLPVPVGVSVRGTSTIAKTLSISDFTKLIAQDAIVNRNPRAVVLLAAFAEVGIEKAIRDLFTGHNTEYLLQKIVHYSQWTQEELEEVLLYNRQEVQSLYGR